MAFQPYTISSYQSGLAKNKKPFLILDSAFQKLENAYVWRETVKKREGIKLVGRLRRIITAASAGNVTIGAGTTIFNLYTQLGITGEPNAAIELGDVTTITLAIAAPFGQTFTDSTGTGVMTGFVAPITAVSINYATGDVTVVNGGGGFGASALTVTMAYYPALPVMGIDERELAAINVEQTIFFDTKYVYTYDDDDFSSPSTSVWSGDDADFFWMSNYRGATADIRLLFATNFTLPSTDANNRIRYTSNSSTWTDFTPALSGTVVTNEGLVPDVVTPWAAYSNTLANTNVIPGTVIITVENGVNPNVSFRDQVGVYPAGTLNGSPNTHSGTINYSTGAFTLTFSPAFTADATVRANYQYETSNLFQARIIIPYYGRLLALNTYEGANAGVATQFFNRCRFSQVGNPLERQAWVSSIFGRGGFIDAPTNEAIVSARFYKNVLIVFFERSTWQLRYVGEYGFPFVWERISSDFGSESTFSTVLFDQGVLAVGDKAIVASSGNDVQRIDLEIPDTVFSFHNQDDGKERVHVVRDFQKEIVFWTYSDGGLGRKFPNRVLLFNYRNNTFAVFRDNITTFGTLTNASGDSWDLGLSWDEPISWDTFYQGEFPTIVSGNHQGFVHYYNFVLDPDPTQDNEVLLMEHESLYVRDIIRSATVNLQFEIPDHNLESGDIIYLANALFVDTVAGTTLTTSLNDRFYRVLEMSPEDPDVIQVVQYDFDTDSYTGTSGNQIGFTPATGTGTYMGGGVVALFPKMDILTKDFNPIQDKGYQLKSSFTDFQTDASPNAEITVNMYVNSSLGTVANLPVFNGNLSTAQGQSGRMTNATQANPCVIMSVHHGLQTGRQLTIGNVLGMTELNGGLYTITVVDLNTFSLDGVDSTGFTAYSDSGYWWTMDVNPFYVPGSRYAWHRFYSNVFGQYITYELTYNDRLMNTPITHISDFQLNGMTLYLKPAGRMIS
jgi:hypothetical protein